MLLDRPRLDESTTGYALSAPGTAAAGMLGAKTATFPADGMNRLPYPCASGPSHWRSYLSPNVAVSRWVTFQLSWINASYRDPTPLVTRVAGDGTCVVAG